MKRATVTLPDDLAEAMESYVQAQEAPPPLTAVVQAALRQYLTDRGYLPRSYRGGPLRIKPTRRGSSRALMTKPFHVLAKTGRRDSSAGNARAPQQRSRGDSKPRILVFDVVQTMLDLNGLRPQFERVFSSGSALDEWFSLLLQYSLVVTVTDTYTDFGTVGGAALEMLASMKGVRLSPENKTRILQGLLAVPPHPDILESLKRLRSAGFRMITLSNSGPAAIKAQLQNAGLAEYFEQSISVESVHRFKPHLEVYRSAAEHLGAKPSELRLIAAHAWDVFGAIKAGWYTAFVARRGIPLFPLAPKPDIIGPDMKAVTDALLR